MIDEAQPVRRRPGRPRKTPDAGPSVGPSEKTVTESVEPKPENDDERIGDKVEDPRWTRIAFPDGRQYRVEDGVIAERTV